MTWVKNEGPRFVLAACAIIMILAFFINVPVFESSATELSLILTPIVSIALPLGAISLARHHVVQIQKRKKNWQFSIVLLASLATFFLTIIIPSTTTIGTQLYTRVAGPINEAVMILMTPMLVSMAYRAFKIKSVHTGLFAICTIVVLAGNAPIGNAISPALPALTSWLNDYPNVGAMRAIIMGVALSVFAYSIRIIMGWERTALGDFSRKMKEMLQ